MSTWLRLGRWQVEELLHDAGITETLNQLGIRLDRWRILHPFTNLHGQSFYRIFRDQSGLIMDQHVAHATRAIHGDTWRAADHALRQHDTERFTARAQHEKSSVFHPGVRIGSTTDEMDALASAELADQFFETFTLGAVADNDQIFLDIGLQIGTNQPLLTFDVGQSRDMDDKGPGGQLDRLVGLAADGLDVAGVHDGGPAFGPDIIVS